MRVEPIENKKDIEKLKRYFKNKGKIRDLNHANQIDTLTYIGVVQKQADDTIMKLNL